MARPDARDRQGHGAKPATYDPDDAVFMIRVEVKDSALASQACAPERFGLRRLDGHYAPFSPLMNSAQAAALNDSWGPFGSLLSRTPISPGRCSASTQLPDGLLYDDLYHTVTSLP